MFVSGTVRCFQAVIRGLQNGWARSKHFGSPDTVLFGKIPLMKVHLGEEWSRCLQQHVFHQSPLRAGLPPTCIFSHPSCSTGVNSADPVSLDMVMYDRTQCPVCQVKFARGMARPHYQKRHPLYARWADRWFVSLVLLMVSATVGYYFLLPGPITLPRMLFVAYFLGGLVALATYRLWYEHNLKIGWEAEHPTKPPS